MIAQYPNHGAKVAHGEWHPGFPKPAWTEYLRRMSLCQDCAERAERFAEWADMLEPTEGVEATDWIGIAKAFEEQYGKTVSKKG